MGKWKYYEFKGKQYTLAQLCQMFEVSTHRVYSKMRFDKMDIFEAIKDITPFKYKEQLKLHKEYPNKSTETIEDNILGTEMICSHFGCNKKLSLTEKLCGNKCLEHQ